MPESIENAYLVVTIQHIVHHCTKSLFPGVSAGNAGGRDAVTSLHGSIHSVYYERYDWKLWWPGWYWI